MELAIIKKTTLTYLEQLVTIKTYFFMLYKMCFRTDRHMTPSIYCNSFSCQVKDT